MHLEYREGGEIRILTMDTCAFKSQESERERGYEKMKRKEERKRFILVALVIAGPGTASLFYQEKMLIINLGLHATSLFNS